MLDYVLELFSCPAVNEEDKKREKERELYERQMHLN